MAFQELDNKLNELQMEVGKVKSATEHIEEAKKAAQAATIAAEKLTNEFSLHLTKVTEEVDKILKPHQELIDNTKKLTVAIGSIDFPNHFKRQKKELLIIKIVVLAIAVISIIEAYFIVKHS